MRSTWSAIAPMLLAMVVTLTACEDNEQTATTQDQRPPQAPVPTQLDASVTTANLVDVAAFCGTINLKLIAGSFPGTPDPMRIEDGACVIDTHSPVGTLTMRPYAGSDVIDLRSRLENDPTVQLFVPQGPTEPYPTTYLRGQHTVWRIGVDNRKAIMLTTEHCCVDAQQAMLRKIIGQHRV